MGDRAEVCKEIFAPDQVTEDASNEHCSQSSVWVSERHYRQAMLGRATRRKSTVETRWQALRAGPAAEWTFSTDANDSQCSDLRSWVQQ